MYANLRVTTSKGQVISAWKVVVKDDKTKVYIDHNNGQSSHAEPGACLTLDGPVTVEADF